MSNLTEINEGLAKIRFEGSAEAFYNPAQEFNRDLTVSVLRYFGKELDQEQKLRDQPNADEPAQKKRRLESATGFRILDALSASGLRALRFAKEVPGATHIVANDFSQDAVDIIRKNVEVNGVSDIVTASYADATQLMSEHRVLNKRFHAVDLDPYGSASPFLNTAVQCVVDKGILMVTCTDMANLCGNTPEAALAKYGSTSFKHRSCHEAAIRIFLRAIQQHATNYDRYIEPLLCVAVDFYVRCFVRIHTGARKAKDCAVNISNILVCTGCHGLGLQPILNRVVNGASVKFNLARYASNKFADSDGLCRHCSHPIQIAGPLYTGNYYNREFVSGLLKEIESTPQENRLGTHKRIVGILTLLLEEIDDVPLYYQIDNLLQICKTPTPKSEIFRSAILNGGYRCSSSHCNPMAVKTDAPLEFIWDVVRTLAANAKRDPNTLSQQSPGWKILQSQPTNTISFKLHPGSILKSRLMGLLRFQDNKGRNHGPKAKAKGSVNSAKSATWNGGEDGDQNQS